MSNFELLYNQFAVMFCWQMAVAARNAEGHGWLRPALGVMELSQSIIQVPLLSVLSSRTVISGFEALSFLLKSQKVSRVLVYHWIGKSVNCCREASVVRNQNSVSTLEFFYVLNNLQLSTN
jgi:Na+-driven multidrug efflux pump